MSRKRNTYIKVDTCRYIPPAPLFHGKLIVIKTHAIKRARERQIAFPDHVYAVLKTGKAKRFGRRGIKFIGVGKENSIICVGEDVGSMIIIKTIERGKRK